MAEEPSELEEQIEFWDSEVYPILSYDEAFSEWVDFAVKNQPNRNPDVDYYKTGRDVLIPHASFSIREDPYEQHLLLRGRVYFAVADPKSELLGAFKDILHRFVPFNEEPDLDGAFGYALGIDAEEQEKKVYIVKSQKNIRGYTYKEDKLVETKEYTRDTGDETVWRAQGERGNRKRIGFIPRTDNPLAESLDNLSFVDFKYESTRAVAARILRTDLFYLDNISYSIERGTTLYFG